MSKARPGDTGLSNFTSIHVCITMDVSRGTRRSIKVLQRLHQPVINDAACAAVLASLSGPPPTRPVINQAIHVALATAAVD